MDNPRIVIITLYSYETFVSSTANKTFSHISSLNNATLRKYQIIWYSLVNTMLLGYLN